MVKKQQNKLVTFLLPEFSPSGASEQEVYALAENVLAQLAERLQGQELHFINADESGRWSSMREANVHNLQNVIFFQLQGGCQFVMPERVIELYPGDVLIVPSGVPRYEKSNNFGAKNFLNLVFSEKCGVNAALHFGHDEAPRKRRCPRGTCAYAFRNTEVYHYITMALGECNAASDPEGTIANSLLSGLVAKMRRDLSGAVCIKVGDGENTDPMVHPFARRAMRIIMEDTPNKFPKCEELATRIGCTENYLSTLFLRSYGYTVKRFVDKLRFDYALNLLKGGSHSVGEVAELCGFLDSSYFAREFKRRFQVPPSAIR